jgi:hypothetical protein
VEVILQEIYDDDVVFGGVGVVVVASYSPKKNTEELQ